VPKYGITVNAISPRAVTDMTDSVPDEVRAKKDASWAGSSVVRRGTPEQVAPLVVYLASDDAASINGQVIGLGGDKLSLWSHPREVAEAFVFGGWSVDNLRDLFNASVGFEPQTLGNKD
jgi:NAD(P)-dependent dehydrogenase (short-subunit alcohol dehydrogenase family)